MEHVGVRERKQAERRARVIDVALSLAREGGYDAVQMREVSAQADVALGTIYRYFASKDEILAEGLVHWVEQLRGRMVRRAPRGATLADRLADTLRAASRIPDDLAPLLRALMTAMSAPSITVADTSRNLQRHMWGIVRDALRDAPADVDVEGVSRVLAHVWSSGISQWVGGVNPPQSIGDDLALAAHLLLDR